MRLHGWCEKCHKIKRVRVAGSALALAKTRGGVLSGVCLDCELADEARRRGGSRRL